MSDSPFSADDNPYQTPQIPSISTGAGSSDSNLDRAAEMLRQTKPWVRFISVMFFIGAVFLVFGGIFLVALGASDMPGGMGAGLGLIYIVMAGLYIAPGVFLWPYANRIDVFMRHKTPSTLASALESQKSFWRFVGIVTLVVIVIYALMLLLVVVFAMGSTLT